jgi:hypothetical protein
MTAHEDDPRLSRPDSGKGRMQRLVLQLLLDHQAAGEIPTSGRFVFYELEGKGHVRKTNKDDKSRRGTGDEPRELEVIDALMWLRDKGVIPWDWIVDETRALHQYSGKTYSNIGVYVNIDPWQGRAPLVIAESRSLAGVLSNIALEYECDVAATNGQAGGFLRTELVPVLTGNDRPVLYLGDWDHQGHQIEANTKRVLERETGRPVDWSRIAITESQIAAGNNGRGLEPIQKPDNRYKPARWFDAWEAEALGQGAIQRLVRDALHAILPEPLADVRERERQERVRLEAILASLGNGIGDGA